GNRAHAGASLSRQDQRSLFSVTVAGGSSSANLMRTVRAGASSGALEGEPDLAWTSVRLSAGRVVRRGGSFASGSVGIEGTQLRQKAWSEQGSSNVALDFENEREFFAWLRPAVTLGHRSKATDTLPAMAAKLRLGLAVELTDSHPMSVARLQAGDNFDDEFCARAGFSDVVGEVDGALSLYDQNGFSFGLEGKGRLADVVSSYEGRVVARYEF
ncbi:MAG: autotransporter domain-containing protein, partial [Parvularculaceae bacterium]|nr:autotransporter domain-containing protein [Parvularculaceae bacterium]